MSNHDRNRRVVAAVISTLACVFVVASASSAQAPMKTETETGTSETPDRQMETAIGALRSLGGQPIESLDVKEARNQPTPADAVREVLKAEKKSTKPEAVALVGTDLKKSFAR